MGVGWMEDVLVFGDEFEKHCPSYLSKFFIITLAKEK